MMYYYCFVFLKLNVLLRLRKKYWLPREIFYFLFVPSSFFLQKRRGQEAAKIGI